MFESKIENKIGSNKSYNIYFVIEFFRALFGVALLTFAGFAFILFSPVILLMILGRSIEYPLFDLVGPFVLIDLVCFVSLYALLGVEKLLFSEATIREFKNRMITARPTQDESRKESEIGNWTEQDMKDAKVIANVFGREATLKRTLDGTLCFDDIIINAQFVPSL